jgi:hypothetical protein
MKEESRVEAGSYTSAIALQLIGGDEKEPSMWGYNRVTLFLGDINTGTWLCRLGGLESETVKLTVLVRITSNCKKRTITPSVQLENKITVS